MRNGVRYRDLGERLLANSVLIDETGCWEWIGQVNANGYGRLTMRVEGRMRKVTAHRVAYMYFKGVVIDSDVILLHACDNRRCINPGHLSEGTQSANMLDAIAKGRHNNFGRPQA